MRPEDHFAVSYDPEIARTSQENRERMLENADAAIEETLTSLRKARDPNPLGSREPPPSVPQSLVCWGFGKADTTLKHCSIRATRSFEGPRAVVGLFHGQTA